MRNSTLKQTILPVLGVAAGSIVFGVLSSYPNKFVIGICFASFVAIFSSLTNRRSGNPKRTILSLLRFAAASIVFCVFTGHCILGICFCTAISLVSSIVHDEKEKEKYMSFPH